MKTILKALFLLVALYFVGPVFYEPDFQNTLGTFGLWAIVMWLLYWIYKSPEWRVMGYVIAGISLFFGLYREFNYVPDRSFFAVALVFMAASFLGEKNVRF
jgi:hypothetical protein